MKNNSLSQKQNLLLFSSKYNFIDLNNKAENPFKSLLSECSKDEKKEIVSIKIPNIVNFYFVFKKIIYDILYAEDEVINFDSQNFKSNLSNYFYLVLLIEGNEDVINWKYNFQFINTFNKLEKKGEFYIPIYAKIMLKLIDNYKQLSESGFDQEIEENEESLNKIINDINEKLDSDKVKKKLKECNLDYSSGNINNFKLKDIYTNIIINVLLKLYLTDTKYEKEMKKFIEEIDLENIELTRPMMKKIAQFLNEEEKNKYIISELKDFDDEKKVYFYYYLCKYILKKNYFIYQIDILKELKEKIKNILNAQKELNNTYKSIEKLKYIIEFFTDNDKIIKLPEGKLIFETNNYSINNSKNNSVSGSHSYSKNIYGNEKEINQHSSTSQMQQLSTNVKSVYQTEYNYDNEDDLSFSNEENNYELLHFKKYIMKFGNIKSKQVLQLGNHYFIKIDFQNNIYMYDENYNYLKNYPNKFYIQKINNISDTNGFVIIQTDYFKYASSNNEEIKEGKSEKNIYKSNQCFEINTKKGTEYLISGSNGLYRSTTLNAENWNGEEISKESLLDGIKITDSLYAFYSNEKFNEKNIILIYDTKKEISDQKIDNNPKSIKTFANSIGKNTFPSFNNPFYVINVNDNYKILLCACRGYCSNNVNGILITRIEASTFTTKSKDLFDTEDFEVSCFCSIHENKEKKYSYILVGGLETDKRRGMIKLYKFSYKGFDDDVKIEFIQDAIEDFEQFQDDDFDGRINKIFIPEGKKRDVIVQCFGGSCYLFNLPKDDNYIERYED